MVKVSTKIPTRIAATVFTFDRLLGMTPQGILAKAGESEVFKIKTRKNFKRFVFHVKGTESYSAKDGYIVSLVYPNVRLEKVYLDGRGVTPTNQNVRVWCTCPAWSYWGSAYLSTELGYNLQGEEDRVPEMRDPNGSNYMCKHVAGVAQGLQDYSFPELIQMFTENIKDSSITRKSSRVSLFTEEFYSVLPEFPCCGIQETFKSISAAMEAKGFREDYRRTFLKSLTDYNYVSQLNKVGLVV